MKRILLLIAAFLMSALCIYQVLRPKTPQLPLDVHITAGSIEPGMTAKDIPVKVTVAGQPANCRVELTCFTPDGYYVMAPDEPVPENFLVRLDVYYALPKGQDVDDIHVVMDCDGGDYDGTGSISHNDDGCVEAWSYAFYGELPEEKTVHQVNIRVLDFAEGMTLDQIRVEVSIDGVAVDCRIGVSVHSTTGYWDMDESETIPEDFFGRLHVYYYLDYGVTLDDIEVTMDWPGCTYDGTGSARELEDGRIEAWSHAFYGEEPETPPTEPQPAESHPTEPQPAESHPTEPQPAESHPTEPQPTEPEETQPHVHSWRVDSSYNPPVICNTPGSKRYICDCGETYMETLPAPEHDLEEVAMIEPTCTEPGSSTQRCRRCGEDFVFEYPAAGHSWSVWVYENGRQHMRTCSVCGAVERENHSVPTGDVICTGCAEAIIN